MCIAWCCGPVWALDPTEAAPPHVRAALRTLRAANDARGLPFALVDKPGATLYVFGADGQLRGAAPALLGQSRGDGADPGAGEHMKQQGSLPVDMRTTPAGRYASEPGYNLKGDPVVWFDYDAALAIHRLRPSPVQEQRPQRLASATPEDNRITLGCVVVAPEFFDRVVAPALGRGPGVVYVLPETPVDGSTRLASGGTPAAR